jgi:hypothetical protein
VGASLGDSEERPVFLFASGWRSGSTLVQRLLCSHPRVMLWGENRGLLDHLRAATEVIDELQALSRKQRGNLEREGHQGWIPVLNPPLERFEAGVAELLCAYYAQPACEQGRPFWGFKEVRCDVDDARWLARLFPGARFLFLVRHPEACLASARGTTREDRGILPQAGGPRAFVDHWKRLVRGFLEEAEGLRHRTLVYEELVEKPEVGVAQIAEFLDLAPGDFDVGVFDRRVRGWKREPHLERADLRALRDPELWELAERCGYAPREAYRGLHGWLRRLAGASSGGAGPVRPPGRG